jgi:hydrogenase maturation protein HypF
LEASSKRGNVVLKPRFRRGEIGVLDTTSLFEQILDLDDRTGPAQIAYALQHTIGSGLASVALTKARRSDRVLAVSGGASVNTYLMEGIRQGVRGRLEVLVNSKVPPGDGGIALGQCALADSGD